MIGRELKLQLAKLALEHRVRPIERAPLPLLPACDRPQLIEGFAATSDVDAERMSFARNALRWSAVDTLPLLVKHNASKIAGRVLDLNYDDDGRLRIKARVDDPDARRMPAFSVCVTVLDAEICNIGSCCYYALVKRGIITEISVTEIPSNPLALVTQRSDALATDHSYDDALAAIGRLRNGLETFFSTMKPAPPPAARSLGAAPAHIYGTLPAAFMKSKRTPFGDLVARLPVGGETSP